MPIKAKDIKGFLVEKNGILLCPFCNGSVTEHQDDCGGSWIEHDEKHIMGSMQKCVLTDIQINTSSRTHNDWNNPKQGERSIAINSEKLLDKIFKTCEARGFPISRGQASIIRDAITAAEAELIDLKVEGEKR